MATLSLLNSTKKFYTKDELVRAIYNDLRMLQPKSGDGIVVKQTSAGAIISKDIFDFETSVESEATEEASSTQQLYFCEILSSAVGGVLTVNAFNDINDSTPALENQTAITITSTTSTLDVGKTVLGVLSTVTAME